MIDWSEIGKEGAVKIIEGEEGRREIKKLRRESSHVITMSAASQQKR